MARETTSTNTIAAMTQAKVSFPAPMPEGGLKMVPLPPGHFEIVRREGSHPHEPLVAVLIGHEDPVPTLFSPTDPPDEAIVIAMGSEGNKWDQWARSLPVMTCILTNVDGTLMWVHRWWWTGTP